MLLIIFYLFFLLLLKPFSVARFWHPKHYRFATSTTLARLAWTLGVALQLGVLAGQVGLLSEFSSESANPLISIENVTENELENGEAQLTKEQEEDISELEKDLTTLLTITVQEVKKPACSNLHAGFLNLANNYLEASVAWCTWEWDHITYVLHASYVCYKTLETKTET